MSYKEWENGEVFTAGDLNTYLAKQVLITVVNQTERDALPAVEGMTVYRKDLDQFQVYNGTSWTGLRVGTPSDAADVTPKTYVDASLATAQSYTDSAISNYSSVVAFAQNTSNSGNIATATPTTVITVNAPLVSGTRYKITFIGSTDSSVATDLAVLTLAIGSTQIQAYTQRANSGTANQSQGFVTSTVYIPGSTSTVAVNGRLHRPVGTGNCRVLGAATTPMQLLVERL